METKFNQYYITMFRHDNPVYTILHPFVNFRQAVNTAQNIATKSGLDWQFTVTKPKYSI